MMDPKSNKTDGPSQLPTPRVHGYKLNHLVGKGTYGYVYRAEKTGTKNVVAIKCVPVKNLGKHSRENTVNEIAILKRLQHDNIVQMIDFQWDKAFIYMIFEFCSGGELASIIRLKRSFPEEIVQHFLQQLASAMKYLRDNNVAHFDLKPANILITGIQFVSLLNGLNSFNVWRHVILKIADFGFAHYLDQDERINSMRGSPLYMAPEIFKGQEYDARADLWSIGIILYECLFGKTPFHGMSTQEITNAFILETIQIIIPKNKLSQLCYELLKGLLKTDPNKRISFTNFFSHPFIDLEHMPTKESYRKAMELIKVAQSNEVQGLFKSAFYNFREALLYLVPLLRWGCPQQPLTNTRQEELKKLIMKNMEKAEELQQKCGLVKMDSSQLQEIQSIYNLIDRARDLAANDQYSQSLDKYEQALEQSFKIMEGCDSKIKTEFFGEVNDWMSEAETVKDKYLKDKEKKSIGVQEDTIMAEEEVQLCSPKPDEKVIKPDWYLKLKEPTKSNSNGHSRLKQIDIEPDPTNTQEDDEIMCCIQ